LNVANFGLAAILAILITAKEDALYIKKGQNFAKISIALILISE